MRKYWSIPLILAVSALGYNYKINSEISKNQARRYEIYKQAIELCKYNVNDNNPDDDAETCKLLALMAVELKKEEFRKNGISDKAEIESGLLNIVSDIYFQACKSHPSNEELKKELDNIQLYQSKLKTFKSQ